MGCLGCWCMCWFRVLRGMRFEMLWVLFEVLATAPARFCEIDGRVLGGMHFGVLLGLLFEVLVTAPVGLGSVQCGVLLQVQFFAIWGLFFCFLVGIYKGFLSGAKWISQPSTAWSHETSCRLRQEGPDTSGGCLQRGGGEGGASPSDRVSEVCGALLTQQPKAFWSK